MCESGSDFVCLYLDDFCEEIEVEEHEEEDQSISSEASTSAQSGHKRCRNSAVGVAKGGSKRKRKMLNKKEKDQVMLSICDVNVDDVLSHVKEAVKNERHITENGARREFWARLHCAGKQMVSEFGVHWQVCLLHCTNPVTRAKINI